MIYKISQAALTHLIRTTFVHPKILNQYYSQYNIRYCCQKRDFFVKMHTHICLYGSGIGDNHIQFHKFSLIFSLRFTEILFLSLNPY